MYSCFSEFEGGRGQLRISRALALLLSCSPLSRSLSLISPLTSQSRSSRSFSLSLSPTALTPAPKTPRLFPSSDKSSSHLPMFPVLRGEKEREGERGVTKRESEKKGGRRRLQNHALLLLLLPGEQGSASRVLKHLAHAFVGLGRTLEVLLGTDLLTNVLSLQQK